MAIRVYEFSKKNGISSKEIVDLLQKKGFDVSNHMTILSDEMVNVLNEHSGHGERSENKQVKELVRAPMTVAQFCQATDISASDVIVYLLKKGVVAPKNYVLSEKLIDDLAGHFNIPLVQPRASSEESVGLASKKGNEKRAPIVVIVGHIDHGKTTLLDYIRKTRVAEKEKGGITQHLGAYEVMVDSDPIVFLDTPGHEAFSLIRVRGLRVADIAILVVAADDGVMPQTVESIKRIKAADIPVIVALNKIDKATPAQIEATKRGLAQYDLLPEDWGGQVVVVPISAKLGTGVSDLLDVIHLQSQVMDLLTDIVAQCKGFVLEAKMEKGRGDVATVICHQGVLRVGDYFLCGNTQGKVTALINAQGVPVKEALPSKPLLVAGFDSLPEVGSILEVVSFEKYKEHKNKPLAASASLVGMHAASEGTLIIVRADNGSSREAIIGEISKLSKKSYNPLHVISAEVGMITKSDIELAQETKAVIYGFNVKTDKDAAVEAKKSDVIIKNFDIIYKLLEDLAVLAEQGKPVKKVLKKIGEAVVLKVFDIKGIGVVAGAQVKSGRFVKEGSKIVVYRGKYKVGEGTIKSLQRDKKTVKEVQTGFECAFMIDGFSDWIVDDRVECFTEVPVE